MQLWEQFRLMPDFVRNMCYTLPTWFGTNPDGLKYIDKYW